MLASIRSALCVIWMVALAGDCSAQLQGKPKPANMYRTELAAHRKAITKSTNAVTKATTEDGQSKLDAAARDFHAWIADEKLDVSEKTLAGVVRIIGREQEKLNKLRGSPPKRPEFEPFIGKWQSEQGSLSINEFGIGSFIWRSAEDRITVFESISEPIQVAKDGQSFKRDTSSVSRVSNPDELRVEVRTRGFVGTKITESQFTLKRVSKTPDPTGGNTRSPRKKSN